MSILNALKILGINSSKQLIKHDLDYWHLKLYEENICDNEKLIEINLAKEKLDNLSKNQLLQLLDNKNTQLKAEKNKIFVQSSIVNYPRNRKVRLSKNIALFKFADHLTKLSNFSSKEYDFMDDGKYWEIKNLSDFIYLRDDIQKVPRQESYRTLEEFTYLLSFIHKEKIKLLIGKDLKMKIRDYAALYISRNNCVVINSAYLLDIEYMCESLSHELIHYLQQGKPLNIDIEDSILTKRYLDYYNNVFGDQLRCELEAATFEYFPNFIEEFKKDKFLFNKLLISSNRNWTIDWICKYRKLPNYPSQSKKDLKDDSLIVNFSTGEIERIYQ